MIEPENKRKKAKSPFQRFQNLMRGLAAVPKKEVEAEEKRWRASRAAKKKPVSV